MTLNNNNENTFLSSTRRKKRNTNLMFIITFFTALLLSVATYAWLSTSLNVKIKFFQMTVASDSGLFISLDGIDFTDSVVISMDSIIADLNSTYPNHTNQWSVGGLWPVSSVGIRNPDSYKFDMYAGQLLKTKTFNPNGSVKRLLNVVNHPEEEPSAINSFISFDIFLKNASGSPKADNLYFDDTTGVYYEEETPDDIREKMDGIMNSIRIGIVKVGDVPHNTPPSTLQNLPCNNSCEMVIYEQNSLRHSEESIEAAKNYGVVLVDGVYTPTYAMTAVGRNLEHTNGHPGTGIPLITSHFALQNTINSVEQPIFQIPNGLSKYRVYVWLEGQDIDSIETFSRGAEIEIVIDLSKDLAGYE